MKPVGIFKHLNLIKKPEPDSKNSFRNLNFSNTYNERVSSVYGVCYLDEDIAIYEWERKKR